MIALLNGAEWINPTQNTAQYKGLVNWQKMFIAHRGGERLHQHLPSTKMDSFLDFAGYCDVISVQLLF
jgi:hypothetical protein